MLEKNQQLELTIEALSTDGAGIARHNNFVVFVKGTCIGEKVLAQIIFVRKSFAVAKIIKIITASNDRVLPCCPVYGKCGGCNIMHLSYPTQLKFKQNKLKENLARTAKITDLNITNTVPSKNELFYRNKLSLPIRSDAENNALIGFFAPLSHRIVPIDTCHIQSKQVDKIIKILKNFIKEYKILPYDEQSGKGVLRHFTARSIQGCLVVTAVINEGVLPHAKALGEALAKEFGERVAFYVNYNNKNTNVILGERFDFVYGKERPQIEFFGLKISLHPASFFQVNEDIFDKLYKDVKKIIDGIMPDYILDAYCGAGIFSCLCAKNAKKVYGIDICAEAIEDAKKCAEINNIENIEFICGDCAAKLPDLLQKYISTNGLLILDPPRKGCDQKVLDCVLNSGIKNIIYISCDPATLARDIFTLTQKYNLVSACPYDMFPQTSNLETLAHLTLKG